MVKCPIKQNTHVPQRQGLLGANKCCFKDAFGIHRIHDVELFGRSENYLKSTLGSLGARISHGVAATPGLFTDDSTKKIIKLQAHELYLRDKSVMASCMSGGSFETNTIARPVAG